MIKLMMPLELANELKNCREKGHKYAYAPSGYPGTIQDYEKATFLQEDGNFATMSDWEQNIVVQRYQQGYPQTSSICPSYTSTIHLHEAEKLERIAEKSKFAQPL